MNGRASLGAADAHALPERQPLAGHDSTERLSADDRATLASEQLLEAARWGQQRAAAAVPASVPGVCSNCDEPCLPSAVYCDDSCRADHEKRVRLGRLQGGAR